MTIRVLRLMEYTYPDVEAMDQDMGRWYIQGKRSMGIGRTISIKSTVLPLEVLENIKEGYAETTQ